MDSVNLGLLIVALVIVAILSGVAFHYRRKVSEMESEQEKNRQVMEQQKNEQRIRLNKSIQIIAQGIHDEQLSLTEGAIRISVLLDSMSVSESVQKEFSAFYQLSKATEDIPILEQWKQLSTKQKLKFDSQRERSEETYGDFVRDAAKRIIGREF